MKKNQQKEKEPCEENIDNTSEKTSLHVEVEPDDVTKKEKETITDKAKTFAKTFLGFSPPDTEEKNAAEKKETRGRKKKFKFEHQVLMLSGLAAGWIATQFDEEYRACSPTKEHLESILSPLARIADRHLPVGEVNPDFSDGMLAIYALGIYVIHARTTYVMIKQQKEKTEQHEREINPYLRNIPSIDRTEGIIIPQTDDTHIPSIS